jgi:hypothetical protein
MAKGVATGRLSRGVSPEIHRLMIAAAATASVRSGFAGAAITAYYTAPKARIPNPDAEVPETVPLLTAFVERCGHAGQQPIEFRLPRFWCRSSTQQKFRFVKLAGAL